MKKFLVKISIFFLLLLVSFICISCFSFFIMGCQYQYEYNASVMDKISRLKSINEPKIILVGNSNLSFGIFSPMLQESLNMPVVNLGLHSGLGNAFHENMAKFNINSGDYVIVCHSNFSDDDTITDIALAWITLEYHKEIWNVVRKKDYVDMLKAYPNYLISAFIKWFTFRGNHVPNPPYSRMAFNEYGDIIARPSELWKFKSGDIQVPKINDICINRLNELNNYVKTKGATLLVAGYPIGYGEFTPPIEEFNKFQKELAKKLECEIISDYRDYFIPYEYFYNTIFHLNERGAEMRTTQLIQDIKNWQAKHKTPSI